MNRISIAFFSLSCALVTLAAQAAMPEKIDCRSKKGEVNFTLLLREGSLYVMTGELEGEKADHVEFAAVSAKESNAVAFIAVTDLRLRDRFIAIELIPEAERALGVYSSSMASKIKLSCDLR